MVMRRYSTNEALCGIYVIQSENISGAPRHQEIPTRMERHAGQRRGISHSSECLLRRGFTIVKQFNGKIIGTGGKDGFFRMKLKTCDFLKQNTCSNMFYIYTHNVPFLSHSKRNI